MTPLTTLEQAYIRYCSAGDRCTLVVISHAKRMLSMEVPSQFRFKVLAFFDKWLTDWLTADMIAAIEPICSDGEKIVREAWKLGHRKALDVFAETETFKAFASLNRSLLNVIKTAHQRRGWSDEKFEKLIEANLDG